jgi:hypothetical protein
MDRAKINDISVATYISERLSKYITSEEYETLDLIFKYNKALNRNLSYRENNRHELRKFVEKQLQSINQEDLTPELSNFINQIKTYVCSR